MDPKKTILKILHAFIAPDESLIEIPPDDALGDYAYPCFMLAKELKKSPVKIAEEFAKKLTPEAPFKKIEAAGPYINFFFDPAALACLTLAKIHDEKEEYGKEPSLKEKTIMVEYPSPNTNKPLHLGHVRNIVLGSSVARILKFQGHTVIQANLNNDRGIHICKSMLAYQKWGGNAQPNIKSDHFVGKFYVDYCQREKEHPELEQEAQEMLRKWEAGDKHTRELWKLMSAWAYSGFEDTYEKLGVNFDKYYYESDFYDKGKEIVLENVFDGVEKGIFKKDETGAIYADLQKQGLGKKILLRPDGTSIYITQDLYLAKLKFDDQKLDQSIYVVAHEQDHHFKVLFSLLGLLKYPAEKCHHLSYGMVNLPSGRMKSREGTVVDADDIIANMHDLAAVEIRKRFSDLSDDEINDRAKKIGIAALKFFLAKIDPAKDMLFDPNESISFEGETGPYVQYAHARIYSIIKKFMEQNEPLFDALRKNTPHHDRDSLLDSFFEANHVKSSMLTQGQEKKIVKLLYQFPDIIFESAEKLKPNLVANYLIALAQAFNEFYHACPILMAEKDQRNARLFLAHCVRHVLKTGLALLGIEAPEEM
ncbi:MAG: arginine--tRNA ligase [Candidatus Woesearchaeota archaeon]|nr:arginine--tRNA ligase [Candidatus Woesearchaeota archaeon]